MRKLPHLLFQMYLRDIMVLSLLMVRQVPVKLIPWPVKKMITSKGVSCLEHLKTSLKALKVIQLKLSSLLELPILKFTMRKSEIFFLKTRKTN
jgi:hypothetical protein